MWGSCLGGKGGLNGCESTSDPLHYKEIGSRSGFESKLELGLRDCKLGAVTVGYDAVRVADWVRDTVKREDAGQWTPKGEGREGGIKAKTRGTALGKTHSHMYSRLSRVGRSQSCGQSAQGKQSHVCPPED